MWIQWFPQIGQQVPEGAEAFSKAFLFILICLSKVLFWELKKLKVLSRSQTSIYMFDTCCLLMYVWLTSWVEKKSQCSQEPREVPHDDLAGNMGHVTSILRIKSVNTRTSPQQPSLSSSNSDSVLSWGDGSSNYYHTSVHHTSWPDLNQHL